MINKKNTLVSIERKITITIDFLTHIGKECQILYQYSQVGCFCQSKKLLDPSLWSNILHGHFNHGLTPHPLITLKLLLIMCSLLFYYLCLFFCLPLSYGSLVSSIFYFTFHCFLREFL